MKKISLVISLLFIFLLVGCNKSSSDWVKYKTDNDGTVRSYKKVNIDKDIFQVWEKIVFSDKHREKIIQTSIQMGISPEKYNKSSYSYFSYEIDCKKKRIKVLSHLLYDTDDKITDSHSYDGQKWIYIPPDSSTETLSKEVCK